MSADDDRTEDAEALKDRFEAENDPTTEREAYEREMAERGRSDDAGDVGDVIE